MSKFDVALALLGNLWWIGAVIIVAVVVTAVTETRPPSMTSCVHGGRRREMKFRRAFRRVRTIGRNRHQVTGARIR